MNNNGFSYGHGYKLLRVVKLWSYTFCKLGFVVCTCNWWMARTACIAENKLKNDEKSLMVNQLKINDQELLIILND